MAIYESEDGIRIEVDENATDAQIQQVFAFERQGASNGAPQAPAQNQGMLDMATQQMTGAGKRQAPTMLQRMGNMAAPVADAIQPYVRPALQMAGAAGGGVLGAIAGGLPSLGVGAPAGAAAGGALGYAAGSQAGDLLNQLGGYEKPKSMGQTAMGIGEDVAAGAAMELAGPVIGMAGSKLASKGGTVMNALRGGKDYSKALWGKVTGEDIAKIAQQGVADVKAGRAMDYRNSLAEISKIQTEVPRNTVDDAISSLMKEFKIKELPYSPQQMMAQDKGNSLNMLKQYTDQGVPLRQAQQMALEREGMNKAKLYAKEYDFTGSTLDRAAARDVKEVINTVKGWDDWSPLGVDTLKRQISGTWRANSEASKFVTETNNALRSTLNESIPGYAEMTKGYHEASNLLKDLEKITGKGNQGEADIVINRIVRAMKGDNATKHELLQAISTKTGSNLEAMAAGYALTNIAPKSMLGKLGATNIAAGGVGASLAGIVQPQFLAALVLASPRVQGLALQAIGSGLRGMSKTIPTAARAGGILARNIGGTEE